MISLRKLTLLPRSNKKNDQPLNYQRKRISKRSKNLSEVGKWKYDARKDRIYWSEEVHKIHDLDFLDAKRDLRSFLFMVHPDDRLKVLDRVIGCLEGKSYQVEYRIPQRSGGFKIIRSKGTPLFGEDQRPVGILGSEWAIPGLNVKEVDKAQ